MLNQDEEQNTQANARFADLLPDDKVVIASGMLSSLPVNMCTGIHFTLFLATSTLQKLVRHIKDNQEPLATLASLKLLLCVDEAHVLTPMECESKRTYHLYHVFCSAFETL